MSALLEANKVALDNFLQETPIALEKWGKWAQEGQVIGSIGMAKTELEADAKAMLAHLDKLEQERREMLIALENVRLFIVQRVPELKEEDNGGVMVQAEALKVVTKAIAAIGGPGGDKDTKMELASKQAFLAEIGTLYKERKERKEADDVKWFPKAELDAKQEEELFSRHANNVMLSWRRLVTIRSDVETTLRVNKERIINPRPATHAMTMM